jgi:hypothetical protein
MLEVRIKKGINLKQVAAEYYGKWIYPLSDIWQLVDERYRKYAEENPNIEIRNEKNNEIINDKEQKIDIVDNNEKEKKKEPDDSGNKTYIDPLIIEICDALHWSQAKKKISEINSLNFLRDKLLPELEKNNKAVLIKATKERIEVLTS